MFDRSRQVSRLPKAYRETIFSQPPADVVGGYPGRDVIDAITAERLKRAGATPGQAAAIGRSAALLGMDSSLWSLWQAVWMGLQAVVFTADETGEKVPFSEWRAGATFLLPVPFPWLAGYTTGDADRVLGLRINGETFTGTGDRAIAEQLAVAIGHAVSTLSLGYGAIKAEEQRRNGEPVPWERLASTPTRSMVLRFAQEENAAIWWWLGYASGRTGAQAKNPFGAGRKKIIEQPEVVKAGLEILVNHKLGTEGQADAMKKYWEGRGEVRTMGTCARQLRQIREACLKQK